MTNGWTTIQTETYGRCISVGEERQLWCEFIEKKIKFLAPISVFWIEIPGGCSRKQQCHLSADFVVNFNQIEVSTRVVLSLPFLESSRWDLACLVPFAPNLDPIPSFEDGHLCKPSRVDMFSMRHRSPGASSCTWRKESNKKRRKRFIFRAIERAWPDESGAWRTKHEKTDGRCPLVDARRHVGWTKCGTLNHSSWTGSPEVTSV